MRSEEPGKVEKKKETKPPIEVGGFTGGIISRLLEGNTASTTPPTFDGDPKRGLQKHLLQRDVEQLKGKVKHLEGREAARKRAASIGRKTELGRIVLDCKRKHPDKSSERFICLYVDAVLEKQRKELAHVCPPQWTKTPDLPRLLGEAIRDPKFKARIKTFISRVRVS